MLIHYNFPSGMRYSTLDEREEFYKKELDLEKVKDWFNGKKFRFYCIIGRHTNIYLEKYSEIANKLIFLDEAKNLKRLKSNLIEFLPEGVYYDRNVYQSGKVIGQELAFDIDPENIDCPVHGSLKDKMSANQGLSFCMYEFKEVLKEAQILIEILRGKGFRKIRAVYSGRGIHIHVDDDKAYKLSFEERKKLSEEVTLHGIKHDSWVSDGSKKLIRLPFSLHGMVSRICIPLKEDDLGKFDPITNRIVIPRFLHGKN